MTFEALVAELRAGYSTAVGAVDKAVAVQLFGIRYAREVESGRHSPNAIAHEATGQEVFGTEIRRGMRLAPYVILRVRK